MEKEPTLEFCKLHSVLSVREFYFKEEKGRIEILWVLFFLIPFGYLSRASAPHSSFWGNDWKDR